MRNVRPALRRRYYWSCQRKIRYTQAEADAAVQRLLNESGDHVETYDCDFCDGYHVGHRRVHPAKGPRIFEASFFEIGERAAYCLRSENGRRSYARERITMWARKARNRAAARRPRNPNRYLP